MSITRKETNENDSMWRERVKFMQLLKGELPVNKLENMSLFHVNKVFFGVIYAPEIEKSLKKLYAVIRTMKKKDTETKETKESKKSKEPEEKKKKSKEPKKKESEEKKARKPKESEEPKSPQERKKKTKKS
jgi:cell division protein FtsN